MLTPTDAVAIVLSPLCDEADEPRAIADLVLTGLSAAGYLVMDRTEFLSVLVEYASLVTDTRALHPEPL